MIWVNAVLQGILLGGLYALFAAGLSLMFGVMRFVNLAHGDFIVVAAPPIRGAGNRGKRTDYFLTLDMAKELAMVERTARGRQARRYFIDCERQLHRLQQVGSAAVKTCVAPLSRSQRQAINRQTWADVAGMTYAAFHARREALLREQVEAPDDDPVYLPPSFRPTWAQ